MTFELGGVRHSVLWIAAGAALTVTAVAGLVLLMLLLRAGRQMEWPHVLGLALVGLGAFGWTLYDRGDRLFTAYERTLAAVPDLAEPAAAPAPGVLAEAKTRAAVLDLLTRARQYNRALTQAQRDPYRLWPWTKLGVSARRWSACAHLLADAGYLRIEHDRTYSPSHTLAEIFLAVHSGEAELTPLPASEVAAWESETYTERAEWAEGAVG